MIYKVRAKIIEETLGDFYEKLTDGTINSQRPDGEEIVAPMTRAKLTTPGIVVGPARPVRVLDQQRENLSLGRRVRE